MPRSSLGWIVAAAVALVGFPAALAADTPVQQDDPVLRFLEQRVKRDPEDIVALNRMAGIYLQRLHETGDTQYLALANHTVEMSLKALPPEVNVGALAGRARVKQASHDFAAARDDARKLTRMAADKAYPFELLGDALIELGDYKEAADAYDAMEERAPETINTQTRLSRQSFLHGRSDEARQHLRQALERVEHLNPPSPQTTAWCHWQLGDLLYAAGDYAEAKKHYESALAARPNYHRALASMGRVLSALDDRAGAIEHYEKASRILPDLGYVAALGDQYHLADRQKEADAQYGLIEQIAKLAAAAGVPQDRRLALFWADHDLKPQEAYAIAVREYETRKDIYGADAVTWTAVKAGKVAEAIKAAEKSLALNTPDANVWYHAGMASLAAGKKEVARTRLQKALDLNPKFDALQAPKARAAMEAAGKP